MTHHGSTTTLSTELCRPLNGNSLQKTKPITSTGRKKDLQLAQAIANGDQKVFSRLVEQYYPGLIRFARTFVPLEKMAEYLVKETWMTMLQDIDRYSGSCSFKTWLFKLLNFRLAQTASYLTAPGIGQDSRCPSVLAQPPVSALQGVPKQSVAIGRALSVMTPIQQQIMTLRDMEGFSGPEVCEILGIGEKTYYTQLHVSRRTLWEVLHKESQPTEVRGLFA